MPGIVGIIKPRACQACDDDLRLMTEAMRHESHYLGGQYVNQDVGLYVSWLAHPGTLGECMPLVSQDRNYVLCVVGEHFAGPQRAGGQVASGDTLGRELLGLLQESEHAMMKRLNGWFCGVAVDLNRGRISLFNDRFGMNRVYFHEGADEFLFASEAKSLLRVRSALRSIRPEALGQYLKFNCVMGNETLFQGVSLLPAASSWHFSGESAVPQKRAYFDYAEWESQPVLKPEDFHERFQSTVSSVFPNYMRGSQGVGLSLTAGLDTRVLLAAAPEDAKSLPCYTFGGLWGETFDIRTARKLAEVSHQTHQVVRITDSFLREFPEYARKSVYISDGTHDALGAHDVYFNEVAHQIAPIRLTGKFGSEVVRIRKLIPNGTFPEHLLQAGFAPYVAGAQTFRQASRRTDPLSRVVAEEIPWYELGRVSVEQAGTILRTPYMDNELVQLMYQAPRELRASRDLQSRYVWDNSRGLSDVPTNMGPVRERTTLMGRLSYGMLWALFKVEFIYLYATPHWLARVDRMFEGARLERIIAGRQKFEGYRIWFKTHLADYLRDTLLNPQARYAQFFDRRRTEDMVKRHTAGTHNYMNEINKILTVELICASLLAA